MQPLLPRIRHYEDWSDWGCSSKSDSPLRRIRWTAEYEQELLQKLKRLEGRGPA